MKVEFKDDRVNLDKLIEGYKALKNKAVVVGVMEDADPKIQVIASANEFGATIKSQKALRYMRMLAKLYGVELKGERKEVIIIPERSYLRSTADDPEVQNKVIETMQFYLYRALTGQNTFEEVLSRAGEYLRRMIQARIKTGSTPPPNHPLTEAMKGHNKTLLGKTLKLIRVIEYRIVDK